MSDALLPFKVYRATPSQVTPGAEVSVLLGATRHLEDAKAILKNWHRGYITKGDITLAVYRKNMDA